MDNTEFLGIYIARNDALKAVFPEENACGLWQAWRMPGGDYIVQPLDMGRRPCGNLSMMQAEDFVYSLTPLPTDEEIAAVGRRFLRADSPDLLDIWYEQGREEQARQNASGPDHSAASGAQAPQPAVPRPEAPRAHQPLAGPFSLPSVDSAMPAPSAAAEGAVRTALAEPPASVGSFFVEPEETPPSQDSFEDMLQAVSDIFAREQDRQRLPSLFDAPEADASGVRSAPPEETSSAPGSEGSFYEERAAILENSMREEFSMLIGQLDESPYPAVEKEVEKLLSRGSSFTWKQKFMFSEFGMALRRKGKAYLALMAHERALGLAPGDGHILFNLARSEYELGDIAAARKYLEQALSVLPDFAPARSFLTFLEGQQEGTAFY